MLEIIDSLNGPARIKVFGVGGGGSNAVNRMIQAGLSGVEFWVANTDAQALNKATCSNRLQIGCAVTRGLGAGGDPEIGRLSAQEDRDAIAEVLRGTDMLFITAGMGGGTGTGGAPVVAEIAREHGILTVAIVTKPFSFEGKKKMTRAAAGLAELGRMVDTLIAIPNQKLLNIVEPGTPFLAAMLVADEVLFQATRGISDLITGHGEINLDFADVKTVMRNRGNALLGCGVASGKDRAIEAAQAAVSSPLLEEVSIYGAEALLINVQGGPGMGLHEAAQAAEFISERVGDDADVFWGAVVDPLLDEEMRVTLIATGFPKEAAAREARGLGTELSSGRRADPVEFHLPVSPAARRAEAVFALNATPSETETARPEPPAPEPVRAAAPEPVRAAAPEPVRAAAPETRFAQETRTELKSPLEMVFASAPCGEGEGIDSLENDLLASWNYERPAEKEIFLQPDPETRTPNFSRPAVMRETWEPAGSSGPLGAGRSGRAPAAARTRGSFTHRLDPIAEPRLGRRSPLDEPTFMRKRMD